MSQQTAVEWLQQQYDNCPAYEESILESEWEEAKQMELEQRKEDFKIGYSQGYLDAQCNHIHDGDNFANEQEYINSKESDIEITDYRIGPFGTPEKI